MRFLLLVLCLAITGCPKSNDNDPIEVAIVSPEPGELVNDALVRVRGTASGTNVVDVNGEVVDVVGDEWEVLLPFEQGEQTVVARHADAEATVTFTVDSLPPALVVTAPERAIYLDESTEPDTIRVTGTISEEGSGLDFLKVGETIVTPAVSGAWQLDVPLEIGLNEIAVVAKDTAGNETSDVRGIMYGTFEDPTTDIEPGFNIFIRPSGFDGIEETIKGFATPDRLKAFIETSFMNDNFTIESINFDPLDIALEPGDGFIRMPLVVTNIELQASFLVGGTEYPATVQISRVEATLDAFPSVDANGGLAVSFQNDSVTILEQDIFFNINGITQDDIDFVRGIIVSVAEFAFGQALNQDILNNLFDPNILIRKAELLGRELTFQLKFEEIDVFPDGMSVRTVFVMPAEKAADVRDVPGALANLPGPATPEEPSGDMFFTTTNYSIDRLLHGIWRSGLLNLTLSGDSFAGIQIPFELTAGGLAAVLDARISTIAGPSAAAALKIEAMLPPVADFQPESGRLNIRAGEFRVSFLIEGDSGPITIAELSSFLTLDVDISIDGVVVGLAFDTNLKADLISEPEIDLDDEKAEALFNDLIAVIPTLFSQELSLQGEADIVWVTLSDPDIAVHGVNEDYASFGLTLTPNPDGFDAPPAQE